MDKEVREDGCIRERERERERIHEKNRHQTPYWSSDERERDRQIDLQIDRQIDGEKERKKKVGVDKAPDGKKKWRWDQEENLWIKVKDGSLEVSQ